MVSRPDGNAEFVEKHTDVVGVYVAYIERQHCRLVLGFSIDFHSGNLFEQGSGIFKKVDLMTFYILKTEILNKIESFRECRYIDEVGVPASNLNGRSANVVCSKLTCFIISPPPW